MWYFQNFNVKNFYFCNFWKCLKNLVWISFFGISVSTISVSVVFINLNKNIFENKIQNQNVNFAYYKKHYNF